MAVTPQDARRIAALARLELAEDETVTMAEQLSSILAHIQALGQVDVRDAPALAAVGDAPAPLRADSPGHDSLARPVAEIAPAWDHPYFVVPRLAALDADALAAEAESA